jgi:hypothetical protein
MILAHQGGWDEMLLVVGPIAVIVFLLRLAKKRSLQLDREGEGEADIDE